VPGKVTWWFAAVAVSLAGLGASTPTGRSYREIVEEFRADPDRGVEQVLELPDDAIADGIDEAVHAGSVWSLQERGAALLLHTDAALLLLERDRPNVWIHLDRAQRLADALALDPESAWFVHQWFVVLTVVLKDDVRAHHLVERWHAEPWYPATAAMDHGLDLESSGSVLGSLKPTRGLEMEVYDPDAFRQAEPFFRQALAAHLEIAAVHLGRLKLVRGHNREARELFEQAAGTSHWRTTTYLANLFLGSLEEHDGQQPQAELRYKAAVQLIGTAQTGRLALAALLGRIGRGAEAARVLAESSGDPASLAAFDPWWSYLYPYGDRRFGTRMILGELHIAVVR
jgi:hypothetical protein